MALSMKHQHCRVMDAREACVRVSPWQSHPRPAPVQSTHWLQRRRAFIPAASAAAAAGAGGAQPAPQASHRAGWDRLTDGMVGSASIPFSVLVVPQVLSNIGYMAAGNMSALSVISWEGYLSGLLGNTLMCSHFANAGERSAMMVQLVGIANNVAVLLQVALASCMPMAVFLTALTGVTVAVGMSMARLTGRIPATATGASPSAQGGTGKAGGGGLGVWQLWQLVSGVLGLSVVPQVLYNVLAPASPSLLPGLITLALLTLWFAVPGNRRGAGTQGSGPTVEQLPGLASTLLFALSPLPQLVRNFLEPTSLAGLSVGTMLLALVGNSLMVPRALFVKDPIWTLGTTWACMAGWGQLLSMYIRAAPDTGLRYVSTPIFVGVTAAMAAYAAFVAWGTSKAAAEAA